MSVLDDAIGRAETLLQELKDAKAELETTAADTPQPVAAALLAAVPLSAAADEDTAPEAAPDNELPFKCPGCGATYDKQVDCTNGHPAESTLPTADVLAGAEPGQETPPAETPPADGSDATSSSTAEVPPADPPWPDAQK